MTNILDFISCVFHTENIKIGRMHVLEPTFKEELRQKYIKNLPEGMTDSKLFDMHYFLTEEDDFDEEEFEDGFYIF